MENALNTFFGAWSETDADARLSMIRDACSSEAVYSDPRSGTTLTSLSDIADYVGNFSVNAPGWTAKVVSFDNVNGFGRAIIAFGGKGPDGSEMVQNGTYFLQSDDNGKLTLLAGFVGTGAQE